MRTVEGPFWRRREVRPVERPEWLLLPASPEEQEVVGGFYDDGIVFPEDLETQLRDWADGRLPRGGEVFRLEWMSGEDAEAARQKCRADWW